jgi:hypothetical protein
LCFVGLGVWLGFGLGEVELGLGVGEGDLEVELGVGEGEVVVDDFGSGVPEDDVAVALDEGLPLADVLGEADLLLLADVLGLADELADLNGEEELASAAPGPWLVASFVADDSAVLFGISPHTADFLVDWLLASAACSSANVLQPIKANPASAPTAAGLSINALTCESSSAFWLR